MMDTIQVLGKIDADLHEKDSTYRIVRNSIATESPICHKEINDSIAMAYLWTLGAYEIIRTINEFYAKDINSAPYTQSQPVKKLFAEVRIPLAKFEGAGGNGKTKKYLTAHPALNQTDGIGWITPNKGFISRLKLSEDFLNFLECLAILPNPS